MMEARRARPIQMAEASQTVDLAGKVLDRVSGGVKTLLQTQV